MRFFFGFPVHTYKSCVYIMFTLSWTALCLQKYFIAKKKCKSWFFWLVEGLSACKKTHTSAKCRRAKNSKMRYACILLCIMTIFRICSERDPFRNIWLLVLRPYLPQNANISISSFMRYYSWNIWKTTPISPLE